MMTRACTETCVTETGRDHDQTRVTRCHVSRGRETWGEYECHYSCEGCEPATSCKEGMTCFNDLLFVEFLVDHLVQELRVDPTRVHVTGLSNGAQV